jgi:hypothetical protein
VGNTLRRVFGRISSLTVNLQVKSTRKEQHGGVRIWKNFDDQVQPATERSDAIDEGWFEGYDSIKIVCVLLFLRLCIAPTRIS